MKNITKNNKGFTLTEVLVIVALAGLISTIAVFMLKDARQKTRDTKRLADITQIRDALELYFYNCKIYPTEVVPGGKIGADSACSSDVLLNSVPTDPVAGINYIYIPCTGNNPWYCEPGQQNPSSYELVYMIEGNAGSILPGQHTATPRSMY